jgi:hypothetical protein
MESLTREVTAPHPRAGTAGHRKALIVQEIKTVR